MKIEKNYRINMKDILQIINNYEDLRLKFRLKFITILK